MRKKISESIELKTFLGMLALLVACCALIYAMVAVFLPRSYQTEIEGQVSSDFSELVALLEDRGWRLTEQDVLEFSVRNNASVQIVDEEGAETYSVNFADAESVSSPRQTMSLSARFSEGGRAYHVQANVSLVAVSQASGILLGLLPAVSVAILAISALGAFSCARYYSKPLLRISGVAKRMASLDMTWKCEENRADEIGVLAASLNEMSEKLETNHGRAQAGKRGPPARHRARTRAGTRADRLLHIGLARAQDPYRGVEGRARGNDLQRRGVQGPRHLPQALPGDDQRDGERRQGDHLRRARVRGLLCHGRGR